MELDFDGARCMQDDAGCWLCLRVSAAQAARAFVAGMKDAVYTVCMKRKRQKRSLDANAYAWVLMEKIAAAVGRSKDDKYLDMLSKTAITDYDKLLKPFGLNPDDPAFWNKGLGLISHYIDELERLDKKVFGK